MGKTVDFVPISGCQYKAGKPFQQPQVFHCTYGHVSITQDRFKHSGPAGDGVLVASEDTCNRDKWSLLSVLGRLRLKKHWAWKCAVPVQTILSLISQTHQYPLRRRHANFVGSLLLCTCAPSQPAEGGLKATGQGSGMWAIPLTHTHTHITQSIYDVLKMILKFRYNLFACVQTTEKSFTSKKNKGQCGYI